MTGSTLIKQPCSGVKAFPCILDGRICFGSGEVRLSLVPERGWFIYLDLLCICSSLFITVILSSAGISAEQPESTWLCFCNAAGGEGAGC